MCIRDSCWNLAADIATEAAIDRLEGQHRTVAGHLRREKLMRKLKKQVQPLTAEKLYVYFSEQHLAPEALEELRAPFLVDDHTPWFAHTEAKALPYDEVTLTEKKAAMRDFPLAEAGKERILSRQELATVWGKIAESMAVNMEYFHKEWGSFAGEFSQNVSRIHQETTDYAGFLRQFAAMSEILQINDEEFDYVFYTYGLSLYKNMPLVEPLEYKEEKRVREFVIAIDTSGSCSGELVQKFLAKTYEILSAEETFASKVNIHIIQCDADIQEDKKITSPQEFRAYLREMRIHGLGGTDFRPVFHYVDELIAAREFTNLRGLLYFTDGYGTFPSHVPGYDVAFVFLRREEEIPSVPPWAMRVMLSRESL